jgi:hypothetical protein
LHCYRSGAQQHFVAQIDYVGSGLGFSFAALARSRNQQVADFGILKRR